jgi:hypothetical protein
MNLDELRRLARNEYESALAMNTIKREYALKRNLALYRHVAAIKGILDIIEGLEDVRGDNDKGDLVWMLGPGAAGEMITLEFGGEEMQFYVLRCDGDYEIPEDRGSFLMRLGEFLCTDPYEGDLDDEEDGDDDGGIGV